MLFGQKFLLMGTLMIQIILGICKADILLEDGTLFTAQAAQFGLELKENQTVTGFMFVTGIPPLNNATNSTLACDSFPPNYFADRIVLIERGICTFFTKIKNAADAGAKAAIIYNNNSSDESLIPMRSGASSADARIFSVFVTRSTGLELQRRFNDIYNTTGDGLPMVINASASEYISNWIPPRRQYQNLGVFFGVGVGLGCAYWIAYVLWQISDHEKRTNAVKNLKKVKYSPKVTENMNEYATSPATVEQGAINGGKTTPEQGQASQEQAPTKLDGETTQIVVSQPIIHDTQPDLVDIELGIVGGSQTSGQHQKSNSKSKKAVSAFRMIHLPPLLRNKRNRASTSSASIYDTGHCTVCLEDFELNEEVLVLPCRHIFHGECVKSWLNEHTECPICKSSIIVETSKDQTRPSQCSKQMVGKRLFDYPASQIAVCWFILLSFDVIVGYVLIAGDLI